MTMTVPTVSDLTAGYVATGDDMNNLSAACTFLLGKPITQVVATTARSGVTTNSSGVATQYDSASFDTDGMWSSSSPKRLTVQTPGWYKVRYTVVTQNSNVFQSWMQATTGPGNPIGSGVASAPYMPAYGVGNSGLPSTAMGCSRTWPFYLYAGDYLQVFVYASASSSWSVAPCGSSLSLEWVSS